MHHLPTTDGYWRCVDPRILSPHVGRIRCIASLITCVYIKNLQIHAYGSSVTVTSNCLMTEPFWSSHSSNRVRVSNFMAAYGTGRSRTARDITDRRLHLVSWHVKVRTVTHDTCFRQRHYNEQTRSATARLYRLWLQCSETRSLVWVHETMYTWTSASRTLRQRRYTLWRHKRQCRRQATHDTRLQRQLPLSFLGCPGSGNHTLSVVHCMWWSVLWPNFISPYSTSLTSLIRRSLEMGNSGCISDI